MITGVFSALVFSTLVARLPMTVAAELHEISERLCRRFSHLYVYPANTIHTTVLFLSKYVEEDVADDETIAAISRVISRAIEGKIRAHVYGIGVFPTTVYAQIYMEGMEELRRRIAGGLRLAGLYNEASRQYEDSLNWHLSFSNIARFKEPVQPDKFLSDKETEVCGTFVLN